jgi:hypothetical protein
MDCETLSPKRGTPRHSPVLWEGLKHFIATFEDDTLEVIGTAACIVGVFDSISPSQAIYDAQSKVSP